MKIPLKLQKAPAGFTLIELLVAISLITFVIAGASYGLLYILQANQISEDETLARVNLNRTLDFISDEVRMAVRINNTITTATTDANSAVNQSVTDVGSFSPALPTLNNSQNNVFVLDLEIPISLPVPTTCPIGGPNAGLPPPTPSSFDRVVYYIDSNDSPLLGPKTIYRYGRIPDSNGNINPCSTPQTRSAIVDSIMDTSSTAPICNSPAVLSGAGGFYACVNGPQVDLYLAGKLSSTTGNICAATTNSTNPYCINTTTVSRICLKVPNLVGQTEANAQTTWRQSGFGGSLTSSSGANNNTLVASQSLPINSCQPSTSSIVVSP